MPAWKTFVLRGVGCLVIWNRAGRLCRNASPARLHLKPRAKRQNHRRSARNNVPHGVSECEKHRVGHEFCIRAILGSPEPSKMPSRDKNTVPHDVDLPREHRNGQGILEPGVLQPKLEHQGCAMTFPDRKRGNQNGCCRPIATSATISPINGTNLKPCPEHGEAIKMSAEPPPTI